MSSSRTLNFLKSILQMQKGWRPSSSRPLGWRPHRVSLQSSESRNLTQESVFRITKNKQNNN